MFKLNQQSIDAVGRNIGLEISVIDALNLNEVAFLRKHKKSIEFDNKDNFTFKNRLLIADYLFTMKNFRDIDTLIKGKLILDGESFNYFLWRRLQGQTIPYSYTHVD